MVVGAVTRTLHNLQESFVRVALVIMPRLRHPLHRGVEVVVEGPVYTGQTPEVDCSSRGLFGVALLKRTVIMVSV